MPYSGLPHARRDITRELNGKHIRVEYSTTDNLIAFRDAQVINPRRPLVVPPSWVPLTFSAHLCPSFSPLWLVSPAGESRYINNPNKKKKKKKSREKRNWTNEEEEEKGDVTIYMDTPLWGVTSLEHLSCLYILLYTFCVLVESRPKNLLHECQKKQQRHFIYHQYFIFFFFFL